MADVIQIKHRRPLKFNIAFFIVLISLIYIIVCSILFFTKKKITMYEVSTGTIMRTDSYKGFIIREEHIVNSPYNGNLNYFVYEKERVANKSNICSVDTSGNVTEYINTLIEQTDYFNEANLKQINTVVSSYKSTYSENNFTNIYKFQTNLDNTLTTCLNENILEHLNKFADDHSSNLNIVSTDSTGVIICGYDNYENINESELKYTMFNDDDNYISLLGKNTINSGEPIYKIITNEEWYIYIKLNDEQAKRLENENVVTLRFIDTNTTTNANFEIFTNDYGVYGKIYLNRYMLDYSTERYVNIELIADEEEGFKIPKESIVYKEFYVVPKTAVSKRGDDELGVLIPNNDSTEFKTIEVYDSDDGNYYIDTKAFAKGTTIINGEHNNRYTLSETKKLLGVYRINKGYAIFRRINIIDENDDFYIISKNTPLGISIYDHIIQDSSNIVEGEILY